MVYITKVIYFFGAKKVTKNLWGRLRRGCCSLSCGSTRLAPWTVSARRGLRLRAANDPQTPAGFNILVAFKIKLVYFKLYMNKQKEKLISYCGLYCPRCYRMVVSAAARNLKVVIKSSHICESTNDPSNQFIKELNKLIGLRCPKICQDGGGKTNCLIRQCCMAKRLIGCWECDGFENCTHLKKQFVKNIKKIKEVGVYAFSTTQTK